jgi:myosin heavy subunit
LNEKENEIKIINSFDPIELLNESLANLDKKRKEVESRITMVEVQKLNSRQIEFRIDQLNDQISRFENQVKNYSNFLINKISGNKENRKLLNAILSEEIKSLPGDQVIKAIHKVTDSLKIFDGEIDISKNLSPKDFQSVDEIKELLANAKSDLKNQQALFEVVRDFEKSQNDLKSIQEEMEEIKLKIQKIKSKPAVQKSIEKLKQELSTLNEENQKLENEQKRLADSIAKKQLEVQEMIVEKDKRERRIRELQEYKQTLDTFGLVGEEYETSDDLDNLYKKVQINMSDRNELKVSKDKLFEKLRDKLQSTFADEVDFIKYVEEEIALIDDKERSISSLLESISTQFANPAFTLLKRYEEFKEFVYNKFNSKLSQARISDIESLTIELVDNKRLVEEVKKISSIQQVRGQLMFEFDHSENLKVLDNYLDSGRKIEFDDLFDITLHLTRKGTTKPVDLNEQIESDGTDKMIRLMIIMNIINRLALNDDENRIALFIDEVATIDKQNRPELVRFCKEHHFIPIFAAPDAVAGFGKYYFIYPNAGKININEKVNAMYGERNNM